MIDRPDQKTNDNCKSKSPKKLNHHKLEACTRPFIILKKLQVTFARAYNINKRYKHRVTDYNRLL